MKQSRRLAFLLPSLAIVGCTWGIRPANAETIGRFTGSWAMSNEGDFGDHTALREDQSLDLRAIADFNGLFSFDGSISGYSDQGSGCTYLSWPCSETWSGTFSGGTVSFAAYNSLTAYTFTGTITGGSFLGGGSCDFDECLLGNDAMFSFVSRWTNGWSSEGTLSVSSGGYSSFGYLTMTTVATPEPGSMALLGAGIVAAATSLRRRRSGVAALS